MLFRLKTHGTISNCLRKALVALQAKDFLKRRELPSQEDFAMILAAEISLMDGEYDSDHLFGKGRWCHRSLAKSLELLDGDEWSQAYAEAQALWALRDFDLAIQSVAGTMEFVEVGVDNDPNAHILLWASRAIAVAQPDVARQLLSLKGLLPRAGLACCVLKAMITTVDGDVPEVSPFEALEGVAPGEAYMMQKPRGSSA